MGYARRETRRAETAAWDYSSYPPVRRRGSAVPRDASITGRTGSSRAIGGYRKRYFDMAAAICAILLLLPLFLLIAAAIKCADRGPVFFRHPRIGRNGKSFNCLKFRTMAVNAQTLLQRHLAENPEAAREWAADHKLRHDPRVTPLGQGLRKTSLDELPQVFNILRGEMSFVGPRPIVSAEIAKYGDTMRQYHRARPGLTGPWQVSGRNDVDYARRVKFDREYVDNWSFRRDLAIIAKTFYVVVTGKGCY